MVFICVRFWAVTGHKLRLLEPVFPKGEGRADFEELVDELDEATGAIGNKVEVEV